MILNIKPQARKYLAFYILFAIISISLMTYYLSDTLMHQTSGRQFPINSFERFPLTWLIFPAELFSFFFTIYFVYNLLHGNSPEHPARTLHGKRTSPIAILIPVYNEPREIVERTVRACNAIRWPARKTIYLLDDSTNPQDRKNMSDIASRYHLKLVRRESRRGYKAGNINHALKNHVREQYFALFDADQAPEPEFLEEMMDHFSDPKVGFVQSPQHFVNNTTPLERGAELGTRLFFHSQCVSKSKDGAMPFCGTNAVIRTKAFMQARGFAYYTATEDIDLGIRLNEAGYRGVFVPKILAHGYAPADYKAYSSQQYRWANGNLAILRESWKNILLGRFSLRYQVHTLFTLGWWVIGIVTLIYILVPILSFFLGGTHHTWLPETLLLMLFFNVVLGISMIYVALHGRLEDDKIRLSDAILQYSLITNSMFIYARAAITALFRKYVGFVRTEKKGSSSDIGMIKWNLALAAVCFGFSIFALYRLLTSEDPYALRTYVPLSLWLLFYAVILSSSIFFIGKAPHTSSVKDSAAVKATASRIQGQGHSGQYGAGYEKARSLRKKKAITNAAKKNLLSRND